MVGAVSPSTMIPGHVRQLVAVARELEAAGVTVSVAGDISSNEDVAVGNDQEPVSSPAIAIGGFDGYPDTTTQAGVGTIDLDGDVAETGNYRSGFDAGTSRFGSLAHALPKRGVDRIVNGVRWLDRIEPNAVVVGDTFAVVAGAISGTRVYAFTNTAAGLYDAAVGQGCTWVSNRFQRSIAEMVLFPTLWPPARSDPPGVTRVPPVALDGPEPRIGSETDVLLVPSTSSTTFDVLAGRLRKAGYRVGVVGGPGWERVPALLPSIRMADWVVCSDYSSVMDAAVAGTPCIIYPFSDEQHGFSRVIAESGVDGFQIEHSVAHVVRAVDQHLDPPAYRNGATPAAQSILTDLR